MQSNKPIQVITSDFKNSLMGFLKIEDNVKNQKIFECFLRFCDLNTFYNLMQASRKCCKMVDRELVWMGKLGDLCSNDPKMLRNDFLFRSFIRNLAMSYKDVFAQIGLRIDDGYFKRVENLTIQRVQKDRLEEDLEIKKVETKISNLKNVLSSVKETIKKLKSLRLPSFGKPEKTDNFSCEVTRSLNCDKKIKKGKKTFENDNIERKKVKENKKQSIKKKKERVKKKSFENKNELERLMKIMEEVKKNLMNDHYFLKRNVKNPEGLPVKVVKEMVRRNIHLMVKDVEDLKKLTMNVTTVVLKSRDEKITFTLKLNKNRELIVVGPLAKLFNFEKRYGKVIKVLYALNNEWNLSLNIKRFFPNLKTLVYTVKGMSFKSLFSNALFFIPPLKKLETLCLTNINTNPRASKYSPCSKSFLEMSFFKNIEKFFEDFPKLKKFYLPANPLLDSPALENLKKQENIEIKVDWEKNIINLTLGKRKMEIFLSKISDLRKDFYYTKNII